jgi:hypothetical protein
LDARTGDYAVGSHNTLINILEDGIFCDGAIEIAVSGEVGLNSKIKAIS